MRIFYRLAETSDPEERLEDACMAKALHDALGPWLTILPSSTTSVELEALELSETDLFFGRTRHFEARPGGSIAPRSLRYWDDPAFLARCGRGFHNCNWEQAKERVKAIHAEGKDAFVKSMRHKEWVGRVPQGETLITAAGDMVYSFVDHEHPILMVQEAVEMRFEHRFAVVDRVPVAWSPVSIPLTPLDTEQARDKVCSTPTSSRLEPNKDLIEEYRRFVTETAAALEVDTAIVDVCLIGDKPAIIELNPFGVGEFGLYAMDVRAIAQAIRAKLAPNLQPDVEWDLEVA